MIGSCDRSAIGANKPLFRPIPALLALVAGLALSVAIAAASSTQVGETTTAPVGDVGFPVVPVSTVAGTPSYETPDGVLTKWRFHSSNDGTPGKIKLKIFRATGNPSQYKIVADSSLKDLDADKSYEFDERMSVQKGDLLGLLGQSMADIMIDTPGQPGNVVGAFNGFDIAPGNSDTTTFAMPNRRVSVAATVESDADKDGYGDDTQDQCPTDPKIHSSKCPKTTTTPKDRRRPKVTLSAAGKQNLIRQRGVFVTVGSDENGTRQGDRHGLDREGRTSASPTR